MEPYWSESNGHASNSVKYESEAAVSNFPYCTESSLNFSTSATAYSEDDTEYVTGRRNKTSRQDPLSHRIIEKRRRDRMNSCLADLSRLIPPQYQRKGRGRIEKTEIIEMAIRHLKHLQNECLLKENDYRLGFTDCIKETAKFLYDNQMQDGMLSRLLARLQEHCDEVLKSECNKSRSCQLPDNISASSGSPHHAYHLGQPLCTLRDMLGGAVSASDIEHSNDHNDVKDLSFRNHLNQLHKATVTAAATATSSANGGCNNNNISSSSVSSSLNATHVRLGASPATSNGMMEHTATSTFSTNSSNSPTQKIQQTAVITSTAAITSPLHVHQVQNHNSDTNNYDYDSLHDPPLLVHASDTSSNMPSPPLLPDVLIPHAHQQGSNRHALSTHHVNQINHHSQLSQQSNASDSALSLRLRNYSESSLHEIEHNNNYKYKNHIKERFNHELEEHEDEEECSRGALLHSDHSHGGHALSEHSKDGTEPEIAPIIAKKRKLAEQAENLPIDDNGDTRCHAPTPPSNITSNSQLIEHVDEKLLSFGDIKAELISPHSNTMKLINEHTGNQILLPNAPADSRSFNVPIFALHAQGTYYVPLNIAYNALIPYLNGIDILDKNYGGTMPVVHPINISVSFVPQKPATSSFLAAAAAAAGVVVGGKQSR